MWIFCNCNFIHYFCSVNSTFIITSTTWLITKVKKNYKTKFRITHKEWTCKDDPKLLNKEKNKFTVAGNHKYIETDIINSVQSSLKSHPFVDNPEYNSRIVHLKTTFKFKVILDSSLPNPCLTQIYPFVCLCQIYVKTTKPIEPKFCVGPNMNKPKVSGKSKFYKFASANFFVFVSQYI